MTSITVKAALLSVLLDDFHGADSAFVGRLEQKRKYLFFSSPSIYTRENRSLSQPAAARSMLHSIGAAPQPFDIVHVIGACETFFPFRIILFAGNFSGSSCLIVLSCWLIPCCAPSMHYYYYPTVVLTAVLHHRHWR